MPAGLQESAAVSSETVNTAESPFTELIGNNVAPKGISGALVDLNSNLIEAKKHMESTAFRNYMRRYGERDDLIKAKFDAIRSLSPTFKHADCPINDFLQFSCYPTSRGGLPDYVDLART